MALFDNKRRHPREAVYIPTKIKKMDDDIYEQGKIKDISRWGICLETEAVFIKGDLVEFIVNDDSYQENYLAIGEVRWVGWAPPHPDGDVSDGVNLNKYGLEILKKELFKPHREVRSIK